MKTKRALAGPTLAVAAISATVVFGDCDGPFMMSDDKTETTPPVQSEAAKQGSGDSMKEGSQGKAEIQGSPGDRME